MEECTTAQCEPLLSSEEHPATPTDDRKVSQHSQATSPIGVIGTGNYAIAITKRLISSGFRVVMGSRKPRLRQTTLTQKTGCLCGAELTSISDCLRQCHVIFVAIHMENFKVTLEPFSGLVKGKVLVDVSNREARYASRSNSQYLAAILPRAHVVKAFNTVSAHAMENGHLQGAPRRVLVTSDDKHVRGCVLDLAKAMGFQAVDFGGSKNALHSEDFVLKVFPGWKIPICLTFGIFNLWALYCVYVYFVASTAYRWEQVFLKVLNKPLCMTAITVLALAYLPGQIASVIQVYRGSKHTPFPRLLDTWLKSRKQFGLIAFFLVSFHVIASTLMLSPTYYRSWFHQPTALLPVDNSTFTSTLTSSKTIALSVTASSMVWKGELALLFGIVAFLGMAVQAVSSIQAVADALNWSEWRCVQSVLGTYVLLLSAGHVVSMGLPGWAKNGFVKTLGSITFLSLVLPSVVLILKLVFRLTPLYCYLNKIRRGWERTSGGNSSPSSTSSSSSSSSSSPSSSWEELQTKKKQNLSSISPNSDDIFRDVESFHSKTAGGYHGVRNTAATVTTSTAIAGFDVITEEEEGGEGEGEGTYHSCECSSSRERVQKVSPIMVGSDRGCGCAVSCNNGMSLDKQTDKTCGHSNGGGGSSGGCGNGSGCNSGGGGSGSSSGSGSGSRGGKAKTVHFEADCDKPKGSSKCGCSSV